jgi:Fe-S-cluster formation regulator IscX/YfhJ
MMRNILLAPDLETNSGNKFYEKFIEISSTLNKVVPSDYEVSKDVNENTSRFSDLHNTITHQIAPANQETEDTYVKLYQSEVGQPFNVKFTELEIIRDVPAFDVAKMLNNEFITERVDVIWGGVEKSVVVLNLQDNIAKTAEKIPEVSIKTGTKERYRPHFTLWVNKAGTITSELENVVKTYSAELTPDVIPCRIAYSNKTGPIGQDQGHTFKL